jgi:hypothetical protein
MAGRFNNRNETRSRCWSESRELPILDTAVDGNKLSRGKLGGRSGEGDGARHHQPEERE